VASDNSAFLELCRAAEKAGIKTEYPPRNEACNCDGCGAPLNPGDTTCPYCSRRYGPEKDN